MPTEEALGRSVVPDAVTIDILRSLARGSSTSEAAVACNVSLNTVRRKIAELRRAWQADTKIQLVVEALRRGLI